MVNQVFVLDTAKRALDPIHPGRARALLKQRQAAVFRRFPFTIILKAEVSAPIKALRVKIDPGSRTTGLAVVDDHGRESGFCSRIGSPGIADQGSVMRTAYASKKSAQPEDPVSKAEVFKPDPVREMAGAVAKKPGP